jgi:hypothetical protein
MLTMKNRYIRFSICSILFITLTLLFDRVLGKVLSHFYIRSEYGVIHHLAYSMDSTEANVIILGSSRAHEHYIPKIIEDSLNITCFNTGMDGNYMLNSFAIYKSLVKRNTPKVVLMDISLREIFIGSGGYDELSSLLPYFKKKEEIREIILLKSKFERLKHLSGIYPFNSTFLEIVESNLRSEDINVLKGYQPLYGSIKDSTINYLQESEQQVDSIKLKILHSIASDCNARNIRLIFIQSPRYVIASQEKSVSILNELVGFHGAEFWNYINDPIFLKPAYFRDGAHMNDLGAHEFTKTVVNRLRE